MTWCPHCAKNSDTHHDYTTGSVCCVDCGKVVSQDCTEDASFVKDASGAETWLKWEVPVQSHIEEPWKKKNKEKNAKPAETAAEAAGQLFTKKNLSSKINYDAFNSLFGDDEDLQPGSKKNRVVDRDEVGKEPKETNDMEYNDEETEGHEWNIDNEQQINGYVDDDDGYFEEY